MRSSALLLSSVMVVVFVAGCASSPGETKDADESHSHESGMAHDHAMGGMHAEHFDLALLDGFEVQFKGCKEAGGVSLYNMKPGAKGPTKDFTRASISDDTGDPKVASYFQPITEAGTTGIWHTSLVCAGHSLNGQDLGPFEGGWVGVRVQAPEWDTSGIQRQYFVADLSFNNKGIVDLVHEATSLHASLNLDAKIDIMPVTNVIHTILDDEDHGVFQTDGKLKEWTPKDSMERIRFWMLINPAGHGHAGSEGTSPECECIPISFDVISTKGTYHVFDGTGYLSHSRTDAHGNQPVAHGNVGGMAYINFDRTFTLGDIPQITVTETWLH